MHKTILIEEITVENVTEKINEKVQGMEKDGYQIKTMSFWGTLNFHFFKFHIFSTFKKGPLDLFLICMATKRKLGLSFHKNSRWKKSKPQKLKR